MSSGEVPVVFRCGGSSLIGMLHGCPGSPQRGMIIVVGGPQYRIGSHRQFLLLARAVAAAGYPVLRFDYRGLGDSDGEFRGFEHIGDDIRAAIDALLANQPGVEDVVLWGLCDAASSILFYAHSDSRVSGIALLNPWVRTEAGLARAHLKHYYAARLLERDFWLKLLGGGMKVGSAAAALLRSVRTANRGRSPNAAAGALPLPERMASGLEAFHGRVLLVISGNDLTAREFEDAAAASPHWQGLLASPSVTRHDVPGADHTFSRRDWRDGVARLTIDWLAGKAPRP